MMTPRNKLIINFTPTGMIPTKEMTPHVPVSPDEITNEILTLDKYCISIVHLHARDQEGLPTYRKEVYREIIGKIRELNRDIIICVSTSGRTFHTFEERSDVLELDGCYKPDMASLTLSSVNFNKVAILNSPEMIQSLASKMKTHGIKPELEIFDMGMINYAKYLHKKGFIDPPFYFNFILGNIACAQADIMHLGMMVKELPSDSVWSVGGVGDYQLAMNVCGMVHGGGIRVGLEDNIWFDKKRTILATNEMLLQRIHALAELLEMEIATPQETREMLNLSRN